MTAWTPFINIAGESQHDRVGTRFDESELREPVLPEFPARSGGELDPLLMYSVGGLIVLLLSSVLAIYKQADLTPFGRAGNPQALPHDGCGCP